VNKRIVPCLALLILLVAPSHSVAQQTPAASADKTTLTVVPNVINYAGVLTDLNGQPLTGTQGATFLLYNSQQGGNPLWMETQNITLNKSGHYSATLGVTTAQGLPADIFSSGEARWLAVQVAGQQEQPRVLLVAVPYALKAADAQTIGGLPPSAFMLAPRSGNNSAAASENSLAPASQKTASSRAASDVTTNGGTVNSLPLFTTASNVQNSIVTQTGSGTTDKIGINTTTPNATLYVNGSATVNGTFSFPAMGTAIATGGKNSQPEDFIASAFNSSTATAVPQKFQWQAEPAGNDTATASGTMNLLYASGTAVPAETGLKISSKGVLTFAAGQIFPGTGTGDGTITGVTAGAGLSGGGTTGAVTLKNTGLLGLTAGAGIAVGTGQTPTVSVSSTVPLLSKSNAFTGASNTFINKVAIGTATPSTYAPLLITGSVSTGTGLQTITSNTSTALNSFASFTTQANGVTAEFYSDGLGTGPLQTPSAIYGTYSNTPIGFITNNTAQMVITASGLVGIGTQTPSGAGLEVNALASGANGILSSGFSAASNSGLSGMSGGYFLGGNGDGTISTEAGFGRGPRGIRYIWCACHLRSGRDRK
jgi:hypothetical protein